MMKSRPFSPLLVGIFLLGSVHLSAQDPKHEEHKHNHDKKELVKAEKVLLKGELIDTACYFHGMSGLKHKQCALECIEKGLPMTLLSEEKTLYLLLPDHSNEEAYEAAKKLAGEIVEVKGEVGKKGGLRTIVIASVKSVKKKAKE